MCWYSKTLLDLCTPPFHNLHRNALNSDRENEPRGAQGCTTEKEIEEDWWDVQRLILRFAERKHEARSGGGEKKTWNQEDKGQTPSLKNRIRLSEGRTKLSEGWTTPSNSRTEQLEIRAHWRLSTETLARESLEISTFCFAVAINTPIFVINTFYLFFYPHIFILSTNLSLKFN